jgi:hypothetical protein
MNVTIEGKNVQLLGDPMLNNCGPGGSPANAATMEGLIQAPGMPSVGSGGSNPLPIKCKNAPASSPKKFDECEKKEICAKCADVNRQAKAKKLRRRSPKVQKKMRKEGNRAAKRYRSRARRALARGQKDPAAFRKAFTHDCRFKQWRSDGADADFPDMDPDHIHEIQLGGHPTTPKNLRWMSGRSNRWMGRTLKEFKTSGPEKHTGVNPDCCN